METLRFSIPAMSPITHFMVSWPVAEAVGRTRRERLCITLAGMLPDLDGAGLLVDLGNRVLGRPESFWSETLHHALFHGLLGAALAVVAAMLLGCRRLPALLAVGVVFHLHLLCDGLGSRGPTPDEIWSIHYWAPFSNSGTFAWPGQWQLNAWPNVALTCILLGWIAMRAIRAGVSPFSLLSTRLDRAVVHALRTRWTQVRRCLGIRGRWR
jgi:hypothetical protein